MHDPCHVGVSDCSRFVMGYVAVTHITRRACSPVGLLWDCVAFRGCLRCLDSADAYQDMLMPSFPLEWGKLLCTWKAGETSISIGAAGATGVPGRLQLCCSSPCLAADITHLGVQARGGVDTWGDEIALGTPVSKQQQLLLLHLLLQWHADVQRSRQMLPDKQGPPTVELSQDFLVCRQRSSPLHILLR